MNITTKPEFDHIIETGGSSIRPTIYTLRAGGPSALSWDIGTQIKRLIHDIGPWDMDTNVFCTIDLGVAIANSAVVGIFAFIDSDDGTGRFMLPYATDTATMGGGGVSIEQSGGNIRIRLRRATSGFFDSVGFNDAVMNRGIIVLDYIV